MFNVTILETSKELSAKERVSIKDTASAIKLDEAAAESIIIYPDFHAVLKIENDKAEPTEYNNYVIVAKDGNKYVTGSGSFWNAYRSIADEMAGSDEEWGIKVYKNDSKNYKGKQFITCTIV